MRGRTPDLEPGDIFAVQGRGVMGWLSKHVFGPETDRYHFGLIWTKTWENDYVILESIGKGIAVGRLSMYNGRDVKFYRPVKVFPEYRAQAPVELTRYGRSPYDWKVYFQLAIAVLIAFIRMVWWEHRLRRVRPDELPPNNDWDLICTEAVDMGYTLIGWPLIPIGTTPLPSAFRQAELDGEIEEVKPTDAP